MPSEITHQGGGQGHLLSQEQRRRLFFAILFRALAFSKLGLLLGNAKSPAAKSSYNSFFVPLTAPLALDPVFDSLVERLCLSFSSTFFFLIVKQLMSNTSQIRLITLTAHTKYCTVANTKYP